jgi:outer membrane autotransporter protein
MIARPKMSRSFRFAVLLLSSTALTGVALAADWTGTTSTDWYAGTNWSTGTVPATTDDVNINTVSPNATIINGGTAAAGVVNIGPSTSGSLTINNGAVLNTSGDVTLGTTGLGILTVDGTGSNLNLAAGKRLLIGNAGTGVFTITNSATVTDDNALIGSTAGIASATLSNAGIWHSAALTVSSQAATAATLNVTTASHIFSATGQVGLNGNGTANISDANSTWTASNYLVIGDNGTGVVTVQNGGLVFGASTTVGGSLNVSPSTGSGTLAITNGGQESNNILDVGRGNGYTGTVTVDGAGSQIHSNSNMIIGDAGGTGTVTVTNGGALFLDEATLGNGANATGTLTLDHSSLTMTSFLEVGAGGSGTIMVRNGSAMTATSVFLGSAVDGSATLTFTGAGTTGTFSSAVDVGYASSASLNVLAGAQLVSQSGVVGDNAGSTALVDGPGSSWAMSSSLDLGDNAGAGTLMVSNGGSVHSDDEVDIGTLAAGTVTVTDANSSLTSSGNIVVGYFATGPGTLSVLNGGLAAAAGNIYIGEREGAGTVMVDGAGSQFQTLAGVLYIGGEHTISTDGNGILNVTNGGAVTAKTIELAETLASTGTLTVDGLGSIVMAGSGDADIGDYGTGTLIVRNGGVFNGAIMAVGSQAGSNGTVTVTGAGSSLNTTNILAVGYNGTGTLSVLNGASVSDAVGTLGAVSGSSGTATVDGAGSLWTNNAGLVVGYAATGILTISNGGAVNSVLTQLGAQAGGTGTITVTGTGSNLTSTDALVVGVAGSGTLNISNGATVTPQFTTTVGQGDGSSGLLAIDGAGSALNTGANIFAGGDSATPNSTGVGVITVTNGGMINDISSLELGAATGSTGSLTVDGNGSTATTVNLQVGEAGTGNLTVSNGGAVSSPVVLIGSGVASTGNVTVSGAGAMLTGNTIFYVGSGGTGNLTVSNGGTAASTSGIVIANDASARGLLNIGAGFTDPAAAPGVLDTPTVTFGAGDAAIVFNHTSSHYDFAPAISGLGAIVQFAGVTDLNADSSGFTGTADVHGGTLLIDGKLGGNGIAVESTGTLGGKGTVTEVLIADGGTLLGVEGQTLKMTSLGILGNTTNVDVTLGAPGGAGLFNVAQNLELDGVLNVTAGTGFNAGVYRLFDYGGVLMNNELDIGTVPGGSDASEYSVQTSVAGQVNLINSHAFLLNFWDGSAAGNANNGAVDGGSGVWSATAPNFTDSNGMTDGPMLPQPGFAIFEGAPGTVTVDDGAGAVSVTGMQFASDGYTVTGDAITLANGSQTAIRVGDGTASSANFTAIIASALTGDSQLIKEDFGKLVLAGANTYTGGTIVAQGILQIGNGGTTGSITAGDVTDNAVLEFNRSDALDFTGNQIYGSGMVIQAGTGTTTLKAVNTYTGGTVVAVGTLMGTSNSFGSGDIIDAATLIINQPTDASFANVISGAGSFIKQGAGSLNLTGTNTLTGGTTVAAGRLAVNGSLSSSVVTVQSGATLGGNGTVGGIVAQSGSNVGPGNSIGDLKVAGNYSAAAGSVYQVELDSAGYADRIDAGGSAAIAGGAVLNVTKTDTAATVLGTQYTVLTAAGGVSGNYTVTGDTGGGLFTGFAASSDAHDVYLTFQKIKSFGSVGGTANQIATGVGADGLPATSALTNALLGLQTVAVAQGAFDQLSGEIHASARTALVEDSRFVREAALERLQAPSLDRPVVWGQGFGDWGSNDGTGNAARLNHSTKGFIGGVDVPVTEDWRVGVLGGFSNTGLNVTDRNSAGSSDNYHLGFYGGTEAGAIAVRLGGAYSWHGLQTARTVSFSGFNDLATARYNGGTTQGFGEIGYKLAAGEVSLEPFANLAYVSLATDGFNEAGGAAALHVSADRENVTTTTLGLHAGEQIDLGGSTVFMARGGLGWRHAFGDVVPVSTAAFAGGSGFTIDGVPLAQDAMAVDVGFDAVFGDHLTGGLFYTGQYASSARDNGVKARFDWRF